MRASAQLPNLEAHPAAAYAERLPPLWSGSAPRVRVYGKQFALLKGFGTLFSRGVLLKDGLFLVCYEFGCRAAIKWVSQ